MKEFNLDFQYIEEVDEFPDEKLERSGIYAVKKSTVRKNEKGKITFTPIELLYIGESGDVSLRLAYHEKKAEWKKHLQNGEVLAVAIAFISSGKDDRERAEAACIFEHQPPCNEEHTRHFHYEKTKIITSGKNAKLKPEFIVDYTE